MKILFSPSESKSEMANLKPISKHSFIFEELYEKRFEVHNIYNDFIKSAALTELQKFFELKNEKEVQKLKEDIFLKPTCKAIQRYDGVAFSHLNFAALDEKSQNFILENTLIFSNHFGVILASDEIPNYKFKQGAKLGSLSVEKFYNTHFSKALDEFLQDEEIIDLRAGFYENFYTIKQAYSSYKFLKQGKIVSHFAKAYRGILLQKAALCKAKNNDDLLENLPQNLKLKDIKIQGLKTEITVEIEQ